MATPKGSPLWLEGLLNEIHRNIVGFALAKITKHSFRTHLFNALVFFVFTGLGFIWPYFLEAIDFRGRDRDFVLVSRYLLFASPIFYTIALGTIVHYVDRSLLGRLQSAGFLFILACTYFFYAGSLHDFKWSSLTINIAASYIPFIAFWLLTTQIQTIFRIPIVVIALYLSLFSMRMGEVWVDDYLPMFVDTPRLIFIFSILFAETVARIQKSIDRDSHYIFAPMHLLTPLPLEAADRVLDSDFSHRIRGLFDVAMASFFLIVAFSIKELIGPEAPEVIGWQWLLYGFLNYLYFFAGSYAWIVMPVGLARWWGWNIPDGAHYPLLAVNPMERWRRWNIYYYNWFYKFIFIPSYRWTRSVFVAVILVFLATFFIHSGKLSYDLLFFDPEVFRKRFFVLVSFFVGHGLIVYLGLKFPSIWPSNASPKGWLGIIAVLFLMSILHTIAY